MGLPNRTTRLQMYAEDVKRLYCVDTEGNVYRRHRGGLRKLLPVSNGMRKHTSLYYRICVEGQAMVPTANRLRWLLGTGRLPSSEVWSVDGGLQHESQTHTWAAMPYAVPKQPGTLKSLPDMANVELCNLYQELRREAKSRNIDLDRRMLIREEPI